MEYHKEIDKVFDAWIRSKEEFLDAVDIAAKADKALIEAGQVAYKKGNVRLNKDTLTFAQVDLSEHCNKEMLDYWLAQEVKREKDKAVVLAEMEYMRLKCHLEALSRKVE